MVRMFASIKSERSLKLGHVESKTRSQGQTLEKPCVHSRGHICSLILMKLGRNVCVNEIFDESKTRSLGQILEKPYVCSKGLIFGLILMKLGQHVCLDKVL